MTAPRATLSICTTGRASANAPNVASQSKATKRRRTAVPHRLALPQHPCDRTSVRAIVFAIAALEHTRPGELSLHEYGSMRRELHIRLARELRPADGWNCSIEPVRLDVRVTRDLNDRIAKLLPRKAPAELDLVVERALGAGLPIVEREARQRRAWKRRAHARAQGERAVPARRPTRKEL